MRRRGMKLDGVDLAEIRAGGGSSSVLHERRPDIFMRRTLGQIEWACLVRRKLANGLLKRARMRLATADRERALTLIGGRGTICDARTNGVQPCKVAVSRPSSCAAEMPGSPKPRDRTRMAHPAHPRSRDWPERRSYWRICHRVPAVGPGSP